MRYCFESCVLDTDRRELRRGANVVAVAPQVFDLIAFLVRNRQRVVSKDDLIAAIWGGRIVSDAALTTHINIARSAIGDSGHGQRLIKTLLRKGFRFVGAVSEERASASAAAGAEGASKRALTLPDRPSIAVLAFSNLSSDPEQEHVADGIVEDIITELSRFSELFVIARNSSFQFKGKAVDIREVARELGVRYVLQGSIRRDGDRVRISVQLADTVTGTHRWAERYDRQIEDVFAVQDEVARTIVAILAAHVNKAEIERTINKPPETWQAYDYFLRAADRLASFWSSFEAAELYDMRRLLGQSLAFDPNYARAYARLAWTHLSAWMIKLDGDYRDPAAIDRAYHAARTAVQLDPNLPEAHAVLGQALGRRREHEAAIAAFERAIALNPNFTHWAFAEVLVFAGHPARAIEAVERHVRLDPFYVPLAPKWLGSAHYMLKQYPQALPPLRECVSRAPRLHGGHAWLAATYAQLGNVEQARAKAAELLRIEPEWTIEDAKLSLFKRTKDAEHFRDGLRKAGLPE
jgi:adenylate cyclase